MEYCLLLLLAVLAEEVVKPFVEVVEGGGVLKKEIRKLLGKTFKYIILTI